MFHGNSTFIKIVVQWLIFFEGPNPTKLGFNFCKKLISKKVNHGMPEKKSNFTLIFFYILFSFHGLFWFEMGSCQKLNASFVGLGSPKKI